MGGNNIYKFKNYKKLIALIISSSILSQGCSNNNNEYFYTITQEYIDNFIEDDFDICAHRGFSSLEVENTYEAIELAAKKEYIDYIECDIMLTNDNKIVLSHDEVLENENQNSTYISATDLESIESETYIYKKLNDYSTENSKEEKIITERHSLLNNRTYSVTTLYDIIKITNDKKLILDIKFDNNYEVFSYELDKIINNNKDNILIQSDDLIGLYYMIKNYPNYNYMAIIKNKDNLKYIDLFPNINIKKDIVTKDIIEKEVDKEKIVGIWTIDSTYDLNNITNKIEEYYDDVFYVTNYPDVIACELNNIKQKRNY